MKRDIQNAIDSISSMGFLLNSKEATIGFDGFIDCIVHVIRSKKDKDNFTLFHQIDEFGTYLTSKKGKSCTIELKKQLSKIGGNMPIFANALGTLGVRVNCIGAMGYPEILDEFKKMTRNNCTLYSIADPGYTMALEFNDGKIMFAQMKSVEDITWSSVKATVGLDKLKFFSQNSNILGMVNWSEVENSSDIWEGILNEVMIDHIPDKNQIMYFDLADCSKRHKEDIRNAVDIIGRFSKHCKVILSMNENESKIVFEALYPDERYPELSYAGDRIFERAGADVLIIHPRDCSAAWTKRGSYKIDNFYIQEPKISTGGGDNFNAGLCIAQLMGLDMASSLTLGNAASGFYVKNGYSPNIKQIVDFLKEWQSSIL